MSKLPESICIIDDDASVRNSIKQLLDSDGLEAQTFQDGEDFLAYAGSHTVRLAVLDVCTADFRSAARMGWKSLAPEANGLFL